MPRTRARAMGDRNQPMAIQRKYPRFGAARRQRSEGASIAQAARADPSSRPRPGPAAAGPARALRRPPPPAPPPAPATPCTPSRASARVESVSRTLGLCTRPVFALDALGVPTLERTVQTASRRIACALPRPPPAEAGTWCPRPPRHAAEKCIRIARRAPGMSVRLFRADACWRCDVRASADAGVLLGASSPRWRARCVVED